jgi:hypothetical protein
LFSIYVLFLFIACIACSSHHCLDVSLFEKIKDYKVQDFEQQQAEKTLDHTDHMCSLSFTSIQTGLHALIFLPKPHT